MIKKSKKEILTPGIVTISGKRKMAIARATIRAGSGIVRINKKIIDILPFFHRLTILEPIRIAQEVLKEFKFDIDVNAQGGGAEGQIEASRLAIARALVEVTKNQELKNAFLNYDRSLLVADVRRKERYKPGDSKARAKRQKSYR